LVQSMAFMPHVAQQQVPQDKMHYFPSWAEALYEATTAQLPLPAKVELPKGFRVMFAGNVGAAQDFATILNAAERLKSRDDIHWIILGDGRMFTWVWQEIDRRRLRKTVHMLGHYPLESMPAFYAQADAMLVTLRRDPIFALTIPGKVQSYLAAGRPIVAALDGEGARIIQEAGAGYVSPAEDPEGLARAVVKLADSAPEARERMGRWAAEYYRTHFERNMLFDRLEGWMQELARAHHSR
jgi:colanic acid biosynthesis glycosyl transferase WcaI